MANNKWQIVHECDNEETGESTCWALEINNERYGKYVWISKYSNNEFAVEVIPYEETKILVTCKSLISAKRWVSMNLK